MSDISLNVLDLSGTPRECGRAHGEALRDQIEEIIDLHMQEANLPNKEALYTMSRQLLGMSGLLESAQRWAPELCEEVEGIAEGSGASREFIWAFQHQDEIVNLAAELRSHESLSSGGCTSLGSNPLNGISAVLAQNLDTPAIYHGHQTLIKVKYKGSLTQVYAVSEPGLVGICGLNSDGVGICQNTLAWQLNRSKRGLGAMLIARSLLHQPSLEKAVEFIKSITHASGINYAIGDPGGVVDYECSTNQANRWVPQDTPGKIYHTNHSLFSTDLYQPNQTSDETIAYRQRYMTNSQARLYSVQRRLMAIPDPLTVSDVQDSLSAHDSDDYPVCRHVLPEKGKMASCTNNTMILELSSSPRMLLSSDQPCQYKYQEFSFN